MVRQHTVLSLLPWEGASLSLVRHLTRREVQVQQDCREDKQATHKSVSPSHSDGETEAYRDQPCHIFPYEPPLPPTDCRLTSKQTAGAFSIGFSVFSSQISSVYLPLSYPKCMTIPEPQLTRTFNFPGHSPMVTHHPRMSSKDQFQAQGRFLIHVYWTDKGAVETDVHWQPTTVTHCAKCCAHFPSFTTQTLYLGHSECTRQAWASKASLLFCCCFARSTQEWGRWCNIIARFWELTRSPWASKCTY